MSFVAAEYKKMILQSWQEWNTMCKPVVDLHRKILDSPSLSRSNFLHFHDVFVEIWPNNRSVPPLGVAPPVWEILDPPLWAIFCFLCLLRMKLYMICHTADCHSVRACVLVCVCVSNVSKCTPFWQLTRWNNCIAQSNKSYSLTKNPKGGG